MIKLVIADDHALLREGLARLFGGADDIQLVGEARNGEDVLSRVAEGGIDVLLLDLSMPGLCGPDLIRQIQHDQPALPILVLSMHDESECALRAIRAGARGYLTKDSDFEHILAAVRRLDGGRFYYSARVGEQLAWSAMTPVTLPHRLLTPREHEVFQLLVGGESVGAISTQLALSVKTVSTHKTRIMQKMGMATLSELVQYAVARHLLP
jgi:DNA-binding NarL/FixJ family response regulator